MSTGKLSRPKYGHRRDGRTLNIVARPTAVQIIACEADPAGDAITVTFDQRVVLRGVPQFELPSEGAPQSAVLTSQTELVLTWSKAFDDTEFTVSPSDPAIRGFTGGSVIPGTYPTTLAAAASSPEMLMTTKKSTTSKKAA